MSGPPPVCRATSVRVSVIAPVIASNPLGKATRPSWLAATVAAAAPKKRRRSRSGILVISIRGFAHPSSNTLAAITLKIGGESLYLPQRSERRADLGREELRLLPRGEVSGLVGLVLERGRRNGLLGRADPIHSGATHRCEKPERDAIGRWYRSDRDAMHRVVRESAAICRPSAPTRTTEWWASGMKHAGGAPRGAPPACDAVRPPRPLIRRSPQCTVSRACSGRCIRRGSCAGSPGGTPRRCTTLRRARCSS